MVAIKQQLVVSRAKTYAGTNGRKYITIHETANTSRGANAQAHANLQTNGFTASWHWTVDDNQAIQSFPHTVRCWHAGDGKGAGNYDSIGIEICVNSDGDYRKAVANAAALVAKIMADEGIPIANVVQHNRWSGKNCPANLRSGAKGVKWAEFIDTVRSATVSKPAGKPAGKPVADASAAPKEAEYLNLPEWQREETANIYRLAREKGVFTSAKHEADIKSGKLTHDQAIFLMTAIAGAALNGGKRVG